jgi:hypothetical protein
MCDSETSIIIALEMTESKDAMDLKKYAKEMVIVNKQEHTI